MLEFVGDLLDTKPILYWRSAQVKEVATKVVDDTTKELSKLERNMNSAMVKVTR